MKSFLDTNVLVYLFDTGEAGKQIRARELVADLVGRGDALLSTQVLQEFYVTVTRKLAVPLDADDAEAAVREFAQLPLVQVDEAMVLAAIRRHRQTGYAFWDALIIEAAVRGGAERLLSEDLHAGHAIDGLIIENPFAGMERA
ncbi:MAG: PIN domain-containing protein [Thiohalomonadaceae bacterium]